MNPSVLKTSLRLKIIISIIRFILFNIKEFELYEIYRYTEDIIRLFLFEILQIKSDRVQLISLLQTRLYYYYHLLPFKVSDFYPDLVNQ